MKGEREDKEEKVCGLIADAVETDGVDNINTKQLYPTTPFTRIPHNIFFHLMRVTLSRLSDVKKDRLGMSWRRRGEVEGRKCEGKGRKNANYLHKIMFVWVGSVA